MARHDFRAVLPFELAFRRLIIGEKSRVSCPDRSYFRFV